MKYNTGIYVRLSNDDGNKDESNSIVNQKSYIENFIKGNIEFELVRVYQDDGYTGTNFERPSFCEMISDVECGKINCIIVKDLSRFGRDYIGVGKYIEKIFPENNVRFISINDSYDSFDERSNDDLIIPIKNVFNASYSKDISKKVKSSFKTKQMEGKFIGAFPSYGYKKNVLDHNKLVIDEPAAVVVRRIFSMYNSGYGKIGIAKYLNNERIPCPSEYKKLNGDKYHNHNRLDGTSYWTYSTINNILRKEIYIGNMVQNKSIRRMIHSRADILSKEDWIVVESTHEPIIDMETWNVTQALLKKRGRQLAYENEVSLFSGFIVCGNCGRAMAKRNSKSNAGYFYLCSSNANYGSSVCTRKRVNVEVLEKLVLDKLNEQMKSIELNYYTPKKETKINIDIFKLTVQIDKIRIRNKVLFESYADGMITTSEYAEYKKAYDSDLQKLEAQLTFIQNDLHESRKMRSWQEMVLKYKNITKLNRSIISNMLDKIVVTENEENIEIDIRFKFSI